MKWRLSLLRLLAMALPGLGLVACGGSTSGSSPGAGDAGDDAVSDDGGAVPTDGSVSDDGPPGSDGGGGDGGGDTGTPLGDGGGCITDTSPGQHTFTCDGFVYDVSVPPQCTTHGACGLILDVHGATMSGNMEDDNTNMRVLGAQHGYVVVQPNANPAPPASSWTPPGDDTKVYAFLVAAIAAYGVDAKRVHMTGFSQGGMMTFRFLCAHADVFASVAPAAGTGCAFQPGNTPSREIPVLYMHGTKDAIVSYSTYAVPQRDAVVAGWKMGTGTVVAQGAAYVRTQYVSPGGTVFEFLQHDYAAASPILGGHCYPGSTDPGGQTGQLFPFGCVAPNDFTWGAEAMKFFLAHE